MSDEILTKFTQRVATAKDYMLSKRLITLASVICDEEIQASHFKNELSSEIYFNVGMDMLREQIKVLGSHLNQKNLEESTKIATAYKYCVASASKVKAKVMKTTNMLLETGSIADELNRKYNALMNYSFHNTDQSPDAKEISKLLRKEERKTKSPKLEHFALVELYDKKIAEKTEDIFHNHPEVGQIFNEINFLSSWMANSKAPMQFKVVIVELGIQLYIEQLKKWKNDQDLTNKYQNLTNRTYLLNACSALAGNDEMSINNKLTEKASGNSASIEILRKGMEYCTLIKARSEKLCALLQKTLHELVGVVNANPNVKFKPVGETIIFRCERDLRRIKGKYNTQLKRYFGDN